MTTATRTILRRRHAMNTLFEVVVRHADDEHAEAAADAALDEVVRVEGVLSRFDPASEVYRVNRTAASEAALVSVELIELLEACRDASDRTGGAFDLTAASRRGDGAVRGPAVEIDTARRRVRFTRPGVFLDFGGCGKGYALDRAAGVLRAAGVTDALLHGGTSSVVAIGAADESGTPWGVDVRDPFCQAGPVARLSLRDQAMSSSAVFHTSGGTPSDLIDPVASMPLTEQAACVVVAGGSTGGFVSEALSTALLAVGRDLADELLARAAYNDASAAWVEPGGESGRLSWLGKSPERQGT